MKILVTGGAGFIGSNFIRYWLSKHPGDHIVNLDKLTYAGNLENLAEFEKDPRYSFVKGDICVKEDIEKAIAGVSVVVHFAAESHVDRSILEPSAFVMTNVVGTHVLLESSLRHKVARFHHVSTDEVYGELALDELSTFNERTSYNPRSPYSASKAASDHLVRAYYYTYGLPVTISNCSNNYGPYQLPEKFIPLAITNVLEKKKVPLYGDGLNIRDWMHVDDHCRGIDAVLTSGKIGETYCFGGPGGDVNNVSILRHILSFMHTGEESIEFVKDRPGHDRRYAMDWSKAHNELGWEPIITLEQGLPQTIEWYRTHEQWWKRVKTGEYTMYYEKQYQHSL